MTSTRMLETSRRTVGLKVRPLRPTGLYSSVGRTERKVEERKPYALRCTPYAVRYRTAYSVERTAYSFFSQRIPEATIEPMIYTVTAVALLVLWAVGTFLFDAPGWIHLLLTLGVALWVYGIVSRTEPAKKP